MNKKLEIAKKVFYKNTDYYLEQIKKIKIISKGFTNTSFIFKTDDNKKFQVRVGDSNDIVDRENEDAILNLIKEGNYLYHDRYGNAIKKWIDGKNPKIIFFKKKFFKLLFNEIDKMHEIDFSKSNIKKFDPLVFFDSTDWTGKEIHKQNYIKLIKEFKHLKLVLSHNDINMLNIIYDNKKISLIDFEWGRINYEYYDIANFFRETSFGIKWVNYICSLKPEYDKNILIKFVYFSTCYAYQWTFVAKQSNDLIKYRKEVESKMEKYLNWINK